MNSKTVAWVFSTPAPLPLEEALRRAGATWSAHDSDFRRDSISGPLGRNARARVFKYGLCGFVVNLTVDVEQEHELDAALREATDKLLGEVLPLFEAQEILETEPEE